MKKLFSSVLALALVLSMFSVFAVSSSAAIDLSGCTLASADGTTANAQKYKAENLNPGAGFTSPTGTHNAYFGYFWNYSKLKITMPKYLALPAVKAYNDRLELVDEMLYGSGKDTLYSAKYYDPYYNTESLPSLEALWGSARLVVPVSNGLGNMRNARCGSDPGFENRGYTEASWNAYWTVVLECDELKKNCTDVQGEDYLRRLDASIAALVKTAPIDLANKSAFNQMNTLLPYYQGYLNRFTLAESKAKAEYKAFAAEFAKLEEFVLMGYDAATNYKDSYENPAADDFTTTDLKIEQMWLRARNVCYIATGITGVLEPLYKALTSTDFTAASWGDFDLIFQGCYDIKASGTDAQGKACYDDFIMFRDMLEYTPEYVAKNLGNLPTLISYYTAEVAKLDVSAVTALNSAINAAKAVGTATYTFSSPISAATVAAKADAMLKAYQAARSASKIGWVFQYEADAAVAFVDAIRGEVVDTVAFDALAKDIPTTALYGTSAQCATLLTNLNSAISALVYKVQGSEAACAAKAAIFGAYKVVGTDYYVNFSEYYNKYLTMITTTANKSSAAYADYSQALTAYNNLKASGLLTATEYAPIREALEIKWQALRAAANVGRIFQASITALAGQNAAALALIKNFDFMFSTDAQCQTLQTQVAALVA